jgi:hypothetical protein
LLGRIVRFTILDRDGALLRRFRGRVTGNKCEGDPADESFEARDFNDTPQPIFQKLARDLAARLVRAVGGPDRLRMEIKNQRIDFDQLSPDLQEAFRPYFGK